MLPVDVIRCVTSALKVSPHRSHWRHIHRSIGRAAVSAPHRAATRPARTFGGACRHVALAGSLGAASIAPSVSDLPVPGAPAETPELRSSGEAAQVADGLSRGFSPVGGFAFLAALPGETSGDPGMWGLPAGPPQLSSPAIPLLLVNDNGPLVPVGIDGQPPFDPGKVAAPVADMPEPASFAAFGAGLFGLWIVRRVAPSRRAPAAKRGVGSAWG
jgi:hypothetical protein